MSRIEIAAWVIQQVRTRQFDKLEQLMGPFVAFVDDPSSDVVLAFTDPLGILPLFGCETPVGYLLGTDAWEVASERGGTPRVEGRSLASWLWYGFDCTSLALFEGLQRFPPCSIIEFDPEGWTSRLYTDLLGDASESAAIPQHRLAQRVLDIVRRTTTALLEDRPDAILALSGGWDSRLIAACAREAGLEPLAICVATTQGEAVAAERVAQHLGLEIDIIRPPSDVFDMYAEPYGYTASGYPITRFVTHEIARRYPGRPMLNGFLGDSLVRGSHDRITGQLESEIHGSLEDRLLRAHSMTGGVHLLRSDVFDAVRARARSPLAAAIERGSRVDRACQWVDLTIRQRSYIANNFLQHIDISEALLPFYGVELLRLKLASDPEHFGESLYRQIFRMLDSALAEASVGGASIEARCRRKAPRRVRKMAMSLLLGLSAREASRFVTRRKAMPRLAAAAAGRADVVPYVKYLYAAKLLGDRLAEFGVMDDWSASLFTC